MNKIKQRLALIVAAVVAMLGWGSLIAPGAQALNVYNSSAYFCSAGYGYYNVWRIYDYNAWEESWLGGSHHDWKQFVGQYRDPGMDAYCRSWG